MRNAMQALISMTILAAAAAAQEAETITEDGIINGTMEIDFKTRTSKDTSGDLVEGSPAKNVQDNYKFTFSVAKTTEFAGTIVRQPKLYTKTMHKNVQGAAIRFDVNISVLNPK